MLCLKDKSQQLLAVAAASLIFFLNKQLNMAQKLSPGAKRLRTIIVTVPFIVTTSYILYKRLVLGEQPRVNDGKPVRPKGA
ncbi:hypothetical protein BC943DRAFT_361952 [Umbelopsis sp. AD052]|nr:hypothetical protein BC943DRAFT_361952 [Umbelopsis sp. AD052]